MEAIDSSLELIQQTESLLSSDSVEEVTPPPDYDAMRKEIRQILSDTGEDLHRNVGGLGGLKRVIKSNPDHYPAAFQAHARAMKALGIRREKLLADLKTAGDHELGVLLHGATALKGDVNEAVETDHDDVVSDKTEKSVAAVAGAGLSDEAQEAVKAMVGDWKALKVTDAPNPYFGKDEQFQELGLGGDMAELYGPAHRYIHVDGDEYVNSAKSAATLKARDQLRKGIDVGKIERDIRVDHEAKTRKDLTDRKRKEVEENVGGEMVYEWLATEGVKLLRGRGAEAAATLLGKGDYSGLETLDPTILSALQDAQRLFMASLNDSNKTFKDRVDKEVQQAGPSIERQVNTKIESLLTQAKRKAGWDMDGEKALEVPDYWVEVGRLALQSEYGRCFSCAGAAIFKLAMDPAFDGSTIESVGSPDFDHHFVFVGRSNAGTTAIPTNGNTLVVDVWQANQGGDPPIVAWKDFTYNTSSSIKVFAVLKPADRAALRARFSG